MGYMRHLIIFVFSIIFLKYCSGQHEPEPLSSPPTMGMKIQLCFTGPCPDKVKRTFEVGPTLEAIPDTLQYLSSFQELVILSSDQMCPIEACACRNDKRACQPLVNRLFENFLMVKPPSCASNEPEITKLLENLKKASEDKMPRGVCSVLGTFRKKFEGGGNPTQCTRDAVNSIKGTFKTQASRLDFKSDCSALPC